MSAVEREPSLRVVHYRIEARLDPETRTVTGRQVVRWRNTTRQTAKDLYFHLYLNAFDNNRTTLMTGVPELLERWSDRFPNQWGGIDVSAVRVGGVDVTEQWQYVQPDDENKDDRTVARLPLAEPVRPRQTRTVELDFTTRLPRVMMRSGHAAPFFMVAQWFPKLGVFEQGGWNCHQYHATTEFYADFGVYEVSLTVPKNFVVGHTGVVRDQRDNDDGTKTIEVLAEDVHDFAWVADPRFRVVDKQIGDVSVRLLMQPNHLGQTGRYVDALRLAMGRYREWIGEYAYPVLTVVDPGPGALAAGGMEYPMLITVGTTWWMPRRLRFPEAVTVHEFGHQYWYGMVANNEFEHAWLDEGINSYLEGRIMDDGYGKQASYVDLFGLRLNAIAITRLGYLSTARIDPIVRPAYAMLNRESYVGATYNKTELALFTLDNYLGHDRLRTALREYFERWRFRHPTSADWRAAVEDSVGEPIGWFYDQVLTGTGVLDYAVTGLEVRELSPLVGHGATVPETSVAESAPKHYKSEVIAQRLGEVQMPVEIVVGFDDGSETRERWDGRDRWRRLEVVSTQRAAYAMVDPDHRLVLDVNWLNNSRMLSPGTRGIVRLAGRWGVWFQSLLHALTSL